MSVALRRLLLEAAAPVVFGLTVLAVALGSSSVPEVSRVGLPLRWVMLALLVLVAVALVSRRNLRPRGLAGLFVPPAVLVVLAVLSTAWSVDPELTLARALTLGAALSATAGLALAADHAPALARTLVWAAVSAAVVIALLGVLVALIDPAYAVQSAGGQGAARFRGLGQNPNTMSMLYAVTAPFAAWLTLSAETPRARFVAGLALAILVVSILASGSRGATLAALTALALVVVLAVGGLRRVAAAGAVFAVFALGVAVTERVDWDYRAAVSSEPAAEPLGPADPFPYLQGRTPLANDPNEVGRATPGQTGDDVSRTFLSSSGRVQAWRGAIDQAAGRPLLGYGFGTEEKVFVDRYYTFQGARPENVFIGTALQLGAAGLAALVGSLFAFALLAFRYARRGAAERHALTPFVGAVAAGGVVMLVQSYVTSVGNVAMLTFWAALLLGGVTSLQGVRPR